MDGFGVKRKATEEHARSQLARLSLESARITLTCASKAKGKEATVLFAPSGNSTLESDFELMKCAARDAGLIPEFFDVSKVAAVAYLKEHLAHTDAIIALDNLPFRRAVWVLDHVLCAQANRRDLDITVVRIGDTEDFEDLEFYLQKGPALQLLELDDWPLVPAFLMEAVCRQRNAK